MEYLVFTPVGPFTPAWQILCISALFVATTLFQYRQVKKTGKMQHDYPVSVSILFVPIYEEILFRGFVLFGLMTMYSVPVSFVVSSLLFGLWHLKNIFWHDWPYIIKQMLYAGFVFGPVAAILTLVTGNIWMAVILHYVNNTFAAPLGRKLF